MTWVRCWDNERKYRNEHRPWRKAGAYVLWGRYERQATLMDNHRSAVRVRSPAPVKKSRNHVDSWTFFVFSELFFFLLEEQRKEGSKKGIPPQCGEELHKRPFQPLCGPGRRVWLPTGGLDPQARTKPSKPKILDLFKACFHFRHILRGTGCYNENGESQYHSIPVRFTLCVTSGIHEPPNQPSFHCGWIP